MAATEDDPNEKKKRKSAEIAESAADESHDTEHRTVSRFGCVRDHEIRNYLGACIHSRPSNGPALWKFKPTDTQTYTEQEMMKLVAEAKKGKK